MNWKEFKEWMEKQGVKDEDRIFFIDVYPDDSMFANKDKNRDWEITS